MLRRVSLKLVWLFLILGIVVMTSQPVFAADVMVNIPVKPNGTTNLPGTNYYPEGTDLTVTITPTAGYIIESLKINNDSDIEKVGNFKYNPDGVGAVYTFVNLSGTSYRFDITFKLAPENKYSVTVAAGTGGTISPADTPITVYEGQTRKFAITPNEGYVVNDVTLNGVSVMDNVVLDETSGVGTYTLSGLTVGIDNLLNATFKKEFTITATAGEHGKIEPTEITVKEGDKPEFTITPDSGYTIDKVTLDGVGVTNSVTDSKYPLPPASADHKIHVTFKALPPVQHKITSSAEENGSISPSGDVTVEHGKSQTFTITPTGNYQVFEVLVDGVSVGAVLSYTFEVNADHTINATFHLPGDADGQDGVTLKDAVRFLQIGADKTAK